eukprot:scaffold9359_cov30-Prasinocladus_malaysianus.AAC.1
MGQSGVLRLAESWSERGCLPWSRVSAGDALLQVSARDLLLRALQSAKVDTGLEAGQLRDLRTRLLLKVS